MSRRTRSTFALAALFAGSTVLPSGPAVAGEPAARLAIKGYDPVAYFTMGRPVLGQAHLEHNFDETRYRFATEGHLKLFRTDPERYAPRYRGLCAMGLGAKGYKVEANPENWVIHEERLYLTQREFGPAGFRKDPRRWSSSAAAHLERLVNLPVGSGLSWW